MAAVPLGWRCRACFGLFHFQVSPAQLFTAPVKALVEAQGKQPLTRFVFHVKLWSPVDACWPRCFKLLKSFSHPDSFWGTWPIWASLPPLTQGSFTVSVGQGLGICMLVLSWLMLGVPWPPSGKCWPVALLLLGGFSMENVSFLSLFGCITIKVCWRRLNCAPLKRYVESNASYFRCDLIWK